MWLNDSICCYLKFIVFLTVYIGVTPQFSGSEVIPDIIYSIPKMRTFNGFMVNIQHAY